MCPEGGVTKLLKNTCNLLCPIHAITLPCSPIQLFMPPVWQIYKLTSWWSKHLAQPGSRWCIGPQTPGSQVTASFQAKLLRIVQSSHHRANSQMWLAHYGTQLHLHECNQKHMHQYLIMVVFNLSLHISNLDLKAADFVCILRRQ